MSVDINDDRQSSGGGGSLSNSKMSGGSPSTTATSNLPRHFTSRMRVFLNNNARNEPFEYPDNSIQTSRYTLLTFLPLFLQQQYKKASNIFLLCVCILTFIPGVAALGPAASLFPVLFVLLVAGLKEGYEDFKRHKADDKANSIQVRVLRDGEWKHLKSSEVQVGDICLYEHGEEFRADSIILASSNDDNVAFIETANLDGETTVKIRRAPTFCSKHLGNENDIMTATADPGVVILAAQPDPGLQKFKGAIHIGGPELQIRSPDDEWAALDAAQEIQRFKEEQQLKQQQQQQNNNNNMAVAGSEDAEQLSSTTNTKNNNTINNDTNNGSNPRLQFSSPGMSLVESQQQQQQPQEQEQSVPPLPAPSLRSGLDIKHFAYRGAMLRNTEWCLCASVYTGINTKLFLNLQQSPPRMSSIDVAVNEVIFVLLVLHQVAIFVLSGLSVVWSQDHSNLWYLKTASVTSGDAGTVFGLRYLGYFVLMSFILPASLFVTVEVAKAMQAVFMSWDHGMATFDVASGQWLFCRPKTSSLNEQLGLVRYVFTDKTGTLTQNQMNVVRICFDDQVLTDEDGSVGKVVGAKAEAKLIEAKLKNNKKTPKNSSSSGNSSRRVLSEDSIKELNRSHNNTTTSPSSNTNNNNDNNNNNIMLTDPLQQENQYLSYLYELRNDKLHLLLLNMALCHSVVCFDNPSHPLLKKYEGPSQDELALTASARRNGYALQNRTSQGMELSLPGQINVVFDVLAELEFSSERQMMSVLVRDGTMDVGEDEENEGEHERYLLLSKGADSAMFARAATSSNSDNKKAIEDINNQLDDLCSLGLRTLVFGYRVISSKEKQDWMAKYESAKASMGDRNQLIADLSAEIERDFDILGVVGIEDKLQDAVPETLHFLKQTGITIWMLTGDKRETAVAIAETSRLLDPKTDLIAHIDVTELAEDDFTPAEEVHARCVEQIQQIQQERERDLKEYGSYRPLVLVADGVSLKAALENEDEFMSLAIHAKSAVCCRLSPLLKAQLVRLFQTRTNETVLAIGDGANDVSMIQASMVGIGIMGLEGSQAELSAAYAIPQFKNLKRLLVVHGRYSWYRTTTCLIYTIFKNAALSLVLICFSFYSGFSGQTLFESWLLTMFNTFFTQLTPTIMGGFDTDVDDRILMSSPELYSYIRTHREYFNSRAFAMWFIDTVLTGLCVFFICLSTMNTDNLGEYTGYGLNHYGTMGYLVLLGMVDAYALITQLIYSTATGIIIVLNFCLIPIVMFLYGAIPVDSSFNFTNIPNEVLAARLLYIYCWVTCALVVMCLRVSCGRMIRTVWPSPCAEAIAKRVKEFEEMEEREKNRGVSDNEVHEDEDDDDDEEEEEEEEDEKNQIGN